MARPLRFELQNLVRERWFRVGLLLRVVLVCVCVPVVHESWFLPFLTGFLRSSAPYRDFLQAGGDVLAWPYGPAMTLFHLPTILVGLAGAGVAAASVIFGLSLIIADLAILLVIRRLSPKGTWKQASILWWLSPASLVISYWHGQTDVVPLFFLMAALVGFQVRWWRAAGVLIGMSIAAKLTMLFAAPFILVWLLSSRRHSDRLWQVATPVVLIVSASYAGLLASPGARQMLLQNPVVSQVAVASMDLHGTSVMLLPMLLTGLLYAEARSRRIGFSLMVSILGTAAFGCAAFFTVAPGWWLWALPFLGLYAARQDRPVVVWGVWAFSSLLAVQTLISASGARVLRFGLPALHLPPIVDSLALTLVVALGFVLAISMFRHAFADNDPYGLARRPILVGIAGPSGVGKDTLSNALARVLGEREVVAVSGDDYHKWERGSHMWRSWTHLNPDANLLRELTSDVRALAGGRSIACRYYDHANGRFEPRRSKRGNDIVLVSGLHALYSPEIRDALDVKVYMDMDPELIRFFKIGRDTTERNHSLKDVLDSIERRAPDNRNHIEPQAAHADLVLRLAPQDPSALATAERGAHIALRLTARVRHGIGLDKMCRLLAATCWCDAEVERVGNTGESLFVYEGDDPTGGDIAELARLLLPLHEELIALDAAFAGGVTGIMQLLVLMEISNMRGDHTGKLAI